MKDYTNRTKKIEIAKEYVSLHKDNDIDNWSLRFKTYSMADDEKYLHIFERLMDEDYGSVRNNAEYDQNGDIENIAIEFETEIRGYDSETGNPVIFEWEI